MTIFETAKKYLSMEECCPVGYTVFLLSLKKKIPFIQNSRHFCKSVLTLLCCQVYSGFLHFAFRFSMQLLSLIWHPELHIIRNKCSWV